MNLEVKQLHPDVGLKYDESVVLGKEDVEKYIKDYSEKFENLEVSPIHNSQMLYGYNQDGNPIKLGFENDLIRRIIIFTKPVTNKRFIATIAYDGHLYNGFQIQKDQKTIQGELTRVVSNINGYETLIQGASRTDTGVHANNYVIHFDTVRDLSSDRWLELLNHQLPKDILVKSIEETHPIFHSRYDVYKKRYTYKLKLDERNPFMINYEWNIKNINLDILKENINQLIGTHNFTSFCKGTPDSAVRTIFNAEVVLKDNQIQLVFEGNGFLRYMIRIIVFALVQISSEQIEVSIAAILKEKSRKYTKNLAPAAGLYLDLITY